MLPTRRRRGIFPFPGPGEVFHPWFRKRFPKLQEAETNALFQAFRQRRTVHHKSFFAGVGWREFTGAAGCAVHLFQFVLLLIGLVGFLVLVLYFEWILSELVIVFLFIAIPLLITAVIPLVRNWLARQTTGGKNSKLPRRLADVYTDGGYHERAALDIYMTGSSGRDLAEAVYLEELEKVLQSHTLIWLGILPMATGYYFLWNLSLNEHVLITGGSLVAFVAVLGLVALDLQAAVFAERRTQKVLSVWQRTVGELALVETVGRSIAVVAIAAVGWLAGYIYFGFVEQMAENFKHSAEGTAGAYFRQTWPHWSWTLLLLTGAVLGLVWRIVLRKQANTMTSGFGRANAHYEDFVQRVLLKESTRERME